MGLRRRCSCSSPPPSRASRRLGARAVQARAAAASKGALAGTDAACALSHARAHECERADEPGRSDEGSCTQRQGRKTFISNAKSESVLRKVVKSAPVIGFALSFAIIAMIAGDEG